MTLREILGIKTHYLVFTPNGESDGIDVSLFDNLQIALEYLLGNIDYQFLNLENEDGMFPKFNQIYFDSLETVIKKYLYVKDFTYGYGFPYLEEIELNSCKSVLLNGEL